MHESEPHLNDVSCASIPRQALPALAAVRDRSEVGVAVCGDRAWVRWETHDEQVLRLVLPVGGVELYVQRDGQWYRHGHHLPAFEFPSQAPYQPLNLVLAPYFEKPPMQASRRFLAPPLRGSFGLGRPDPLVDGQSQPVSLTLAPDSRPHPASALRVRKSELARLADSAATACFGSLHAAWRQDRVLLLGSRLPPIPGGERFWGETILMPLGWRAAPDLCASAIRQALDISDDELLLLTQSGAEVVNVAAFRPLTRAQLRLTLQENAP